MKIGIVGFGRLAQCYYAPALRRMNRHLEICVADPLPSSREAAARAFPGSTGYAGHCQMLERESLHALLVAAPPSTHLGIWQSIKPFELPVFMEKPFPLTDELDGIDPADPSWNRLMINFNRRFWPAYRDVGRVLSSDVLGAIRNAQFVLHVDTRKWSQVSNHRSRPEEGGVLHDLGTQALDLVLTSFPGSPVDITAVQSGVGTANERLGLELRFPDGFVVSCDLAYGRGSRESISIEGEKASLHLKNPNFLCWVGSRRSVSRRLLRNAADLTVLAYRGMFRSQSMLRWTVNQALRAFFAALETAQPFSPGFSDALRVARYTKIAADRMVGRPGLVP